MAADKPAKAPPLYEGGHDKSTNVPALLGEPAFPCKATRMKAPLLLTAMLGACSQQPAASTTNEASGTNSSAPPSTPGRAKATPFSLDEKNDLVEFHFGWSAEAAAVPQLVKRFQAQLEKTKAELLTGAREDKAMRDKEGFDFHGHMSSTEYETAGQSDRLLSLRVEVGSYTGGAHGNQGTGSLLWDLNAAKEIEVAGLFVEPSNMSRLLTQRWCDALNKARDDKRGEPVGGNGMFDECPGLDEIATIPTDKDKNGRFERIMLVASPYVAGSYAEGSYEIELLVTSDLIAALKEDYRSGFEAVQTQ